jgi:hypothetical protein
MHQHNEAIIRLPQREINRLNDLLNQPNTDIARDGCVFDEEVAFGNGYRIAVRVCAPNTPSEESCWAEAVLFDDDGCELSVTNPDGDSVEGEYVCYDGKDEYIVIVEAFDPCVAIEGNFAEGFKVVGPYPSFDVAASEHDCAWIATLISPDEWERSKR